MIIGFAGKAGSGKNTAASMVNFILNDYTFKDWNVDKSEITKNFNENGDIKLYRLQQILHEDFRFIGKHQLTKDKLEKEIDYYIDILNVKKLVYFTEQSFAGKMKDLCVLLTGIRREIWDIRAIRDNKITSFLYANTLVNVPEYCKQFTYREFMQLIGIECFRDTMGKNVWIDTLMIKYNDTDNWVINDVRFENEIQAIKKRGGVVINIVRDIILTDNKDGQSFKIQLHPSEAGIPNEKVDAIISNYSTLEVLYNQLTETLKQLKIY